MNPHRDPLKLSKMLYFIFKDDDFGEFLKPHLIENSNPELNDILEEELSGVRLSKKVSALKREFIYRKYEMYIKKCLLKYKRYVDDTTPGFSLPHFYHLYREEPWIYEMGWSLLNRKNKRMIESNPEAQNAYKYLLYAWMYLRRHKRFHTNFKGAYPELLLPSHKELEFFYHTINTPKFKDAILDFIGIIQHENEYSRKPFNKRKWNRIISKILEHSKEITRGIVVEIPFTYFGMDIHKGFIQKDEHLHGLFFGEIKEKNDYSKPAPKITDTERVQIFYIFRSKELREYKREI